MLYGKYRPLGFDEVMGQDHIVTTLRNALASGQVAHAMLFSGPRGTGKTTTARIMAKAVNCQQRKGGDPCNECVACEAITSGRALDLIEMDAASNRGIDDIRELREKIAYAPSDLQVKVYLLDEVHMLTQGAFNALLKTLEEPPPHAIFILATTELQSVPETIKSRCQRHDFRRVPNEAMVRRLRHICEKEGFVVPEEGLTMIALQGRGGLRDGITLLEQVIARYGNSPSTDDVLAGLGLVHDARAERLAAALLQGDLAASLDISREIADDGIDIAKFTRATIDIIRGVLPQLLRGEPLAGHPTEGLAREALAAGTRPATVAHIISELAGADFRLDPGSPVPLEVACASAVLGPEVVVVAASGAPEQPGGSPGGGVQQQSSRQPEGRRPGAAAAAGLSPDERFLKDLHERCRIANPRLGAWLNESCKVLAMDGDELHLGFFFPLHMEKVDTDCRTLVEQQAEAILGRPMKLKVTLVERDAAAKRGPRGGHLAEVAKAAGAVPVGKD